MMDDKWLLLDDGTYECLICHKICTSRRSIGHHLPFHFGRKSWNDGLTKESSQSIRKGMKKRKETLQRAPVLGRWHSPETKDKIRAARLRYLQNNPDKVPYLMNHSSKGSSYPELYWKELIEKEELPLKYHKQVGLYELDFYNEEKLIDLEIDGNQHYTDKRIVASDLRRTQYLQDLGWTVLRVRWSNWKKLSDEEKAQYVKDLRTCIENKAIVPVLPDLKKAVPEKPVRKSLERPKRKTQRKKERVQPRTVERKVQRAQETQRRVNLLVSSEINFSVYGWVNQASDVLGITPQKVCKFMIKNMPDFYSTCFHRKSREGKTEIPS